MYAPDLRQYCYKLPYSIENVLMVGWLDLQHQFPRGVVDDIIIEKLWRMIGVRDSAIDLHVNAVRGIHPCNVCGAEVFEAEKTTSPAYLGMSEIWIPCGALWLAAPSLVVHYIEDHGYLPPNLFLDAVREFNFDSSVFSQAAYDSAVRSKAELAK